jgi:hypothetical protein
VVGPSCAYNSQQETQPPAHRRRARLACCLQQRSVRTSALSSCGVSNFNPTSTTLPLDQDSDPTQFLNPLCLLSHSLYFLFFPFLLWRHVKSQVGRRVRPFSVQSLGHTAVEVWQPVDNEVEVLATSQQRITSLDMQRPRQS